jgi:dihydroxy-acid dehydratase
VAGKRLYRTFYWPLHLHQECRSHGFCIGHVVPEAQIGGPIALVQDGDIISIDAVKNTIELRVSPEELVRRRKAWVAPPLKATQGTLYKYMKTVQDASHGCITDA